MKKRMIGALAGITLISSLAMGNVGLFADEVIVNQDSDLSNPAMVTVTADVGGQFTVTIPKEMVLTLRDDGQYRCDYTVDVDGEIADNAYVSVIPQSEINISTQGKDDVVLSVSQDVKYFRSTTFTGDLSGSTDTVKIDVTDTTPEANGNLVVKEGYTLTSGKWEGTLLFDINLNWDAVTNSVSSGEVLQ